MNMFKLFQNKNIKPKKILILRFGAIGDVVHSTELFRSLKRFDQDLSIHYLTFKVPGSLLENDPDLDKVWIAEEKSYQYLIKLAKILKKENFDVSINLQPSIRTRFLFYLIGAKYNLVYKKDFNLHAVENFWRTAKPIFKDIVLDNKIKLYLSEEIEERVIKLINNDKILIGLNIAANLSRQGRRWPVNYWINLALALINNYNCRIILTGSHDDIEITESVANSSPDIESFCGKLNIAENAALLSKCSLVISGDTGPLHIATAMNVPVIGLYGSMPISRTGPYGKSAYSIKSDMKCVPCNKRKCQFIGKKELYTPCLINITPEKVLKLIEDNNLLVNKE